MKQILILPTIVLGLMLGLTLESPAQTVSFVTLYSTNTGPNIQFPLQTNQVVSIVGESQGGITSPSTSIFGFFPDGTSVTLPLASSGLLPIFTGFTNFELLAPNQPGTVCVTLQVTTPAGANVVSNYVPADAIVIPASATGNVQIILESSTDLLNWSAASPGTYSAASATNRFFRVRAVAN
ncbi:MAG TPA: hypothetical protein VN048_10250 [Verrucomicrobiae bacterium]|jgi:hypothetical protein|nr:hypothetical protein [Verrucomicrobiae bacterium]